MLPSWRSARTSVNEGSGFQIDGVFSPWSTGGHPAALWSGLSAQSGWMPAWM
jgi:hypothetical protein